MQPKEYIKEVDRLLYLPPRIRSQELKNLQQQINAGLDHGYSILNVETWMNPPDETAYPCMRERSMKTSERPIRQWKKRPDFCWSVP